MASSQGGFLAALEMVRRVAEGDSSIGMSISRHVCASTGWDKRPTIREHHYYDLRRA